MDNQEQTHLTKLHKHTQYTYSALDKTRGELATVLGNLITHPRIHEEVKSDQRASDDEIEWIDVRLDDFDKVIRDIRENIVLLSNILWIPKDIKQSI